MVEAAPKILVAEDDPTLLRTLVWLLKDNGYEPIPVDGGQKLLDRLEETCPDLVLLDIMMPKVDGLQVLERMKSDDRWCDVPVLVISSMSPEEGVVRSLGLGASDFVPKPFRARELVARISTHLRLGQQLRQARREAETHAELADILHEVTDSLKPDEIYHILARRVARVLNIPRCSVVIAKPGDKKGLVVASSDNPMLRNLEIQLSRYPEIQQALTTGEPVLVPDVQTSPIYSEVRKEWEALGIDVPTRSAIALPFELSEQQDGVFFLRTTAEASPLTEADASFAASVTKGAVTALAKAYDLQTAVSDRERYQWLARIDSLTACLNRRALLEELETELERARRYKHGLTILMIDLDRFKDVNDTHGHLVGDSVLKQVGDVLRKEARAVDAVARYGGEEFVLLLPDTSAEGGLAFAERLRERVEEHNFAEGDVDRLRVTVSIGVAQFPGNEVTKLESLIEMADAALYRAKNDGRNLVRS